MSKLSSHPQSDQDFVFLWKTAGSLTADINNRFSSRFPPDLSSALSMRHWIINWIILISLVIMLCNGLIKSCSPGDPASEKDEGVSVDPWLCDWWMLVIVYISCQWITGRPEIVRLSVCPAEYKSAQSRTTAVHVIVMDLNYIQFNIQRLWWMWTHVVLSVVIISVIQYILHNIMCLRWLYL